MFGLSRVHISTVFFQKMGEERRKQLTLGFATLRVSAEVNVFGGRTKSPLFCQLPSSTAFDIYHYLYSPLTHLFSLSHACALPLSVSRNPFRAGTRVNRPRYATLSTYMLTGKQVARLPRKENTKIRHLLVKSSQRNGNEISR